MFIDVLRLTHLLLPVWRGSHSYWITPCIDQTHLLTSEVMSPPRIKGTVHPQMKILSLYTHKHADGASQQHSNWSRWGMCLKPLFKWIQDLLGNFSSALENKSRWFLAEGVQTKRR